MFPILRTLVIMLHGLGIHNYLHKLDEERALIVNEKLFLDTCDINRIMFTNIVYFLFSLLDQEATSHCFDAVMPVETTVQYNFFIEKTVTWLKELSNAFELLRHVPLSDEVFHDCSGPVMHQVMFAFTMAVVKYKILINEGAAMKCSVGTFDRSNFEAYFRIFMNMVTNKNDINCKAFEASLLEHLLTRVYGKECTKMILKNSPGPGDDKCASDTGSQSEDSVENLASDSTSYSATEHCLSSRLDTVYPLAHKGRRIKIKRPFFRQNSPLNENREMKSIPVRSIWELDISTHYKNEVPLHIRLMKCRSSQQYVKRKQELLEAERLDAEKKAHEHRLAEESSCTTERKIQEQGLTDQFNSETKRELREQKPTEESRFSTKKKTQKQILNFVTKRKTQEQKSMEEVRFAADMKLAEAKLKEERRRLAQIVQFDQENYRGTKRKHEEIQGNATSLNRNKRAIFRILC